VLRAHQTLWREPLSPPVVVAVAVVAVAVVVAAATKTEFFSLIN